MTMISDNPHIRLMALYKLNYRNYVVFSYRPNSPNAFYTTINGWYREDRWDRDANYHAVYNANKEPEWLPEFDYCVMDMGRGVPDWNPDDETQATPPLGSRASNRKISEASSNR